MERLGFNDSNIEEKDVLIVSINNFYNPGLFMDRYGVSSHFKRQHPNVMIMHFGDFSEEWVNKVIHEGPTGIFNEYKAHKVYEFIKANKEKGEAILHCSAGISRSGAIGAFINDLYGEDHQTFMFRNPRIEPNSYMTKMLYRELYRENYKGKIKF